MDGRAAKADGMMDGKGERASSWTNRSGLSSMLEIHPTLHHPCGCVFHPASIHPGTNPLSLSLSAPPCPQFWSFIMHPFLSFSSLSLSLSFPLSRLSQSHCCTAAFAFAVLPPASYQFFWLFGHGLPHGKTNTFRARIGISRCNQSIFQVDAEHARPLTAPTPYRHDRLLLLSFLPGQSHLEAMHGHPNHDDRR